MNNHIPRNINLLLEEKLNSQQLKREIISSTNINMKSVLNFPSNQNLKSQNNSSLDNSKIAFSTTYTKANSNSNSNLNPLNFKFDTAKVSDFNNNEISFYKSFMSNNYLNSILKCLFSIKEIEEIFNLNDFIKEIYCSKNDIFENKFINLKCNKDIILNPINDINKYDEYYLKFLKIFSDLFLEFKNKKPNFNNISIREFDEVLSEISLQKIVINKELNKDVEQIPLKYFLLIIESFIESLQIFMNKNFKNKNFGITTFNNQIISKNESQEIFLFDRQFDEMVKNKLTLNQKIHKIIQGSFFGKFKEILTCKQCEFEVIKDFDFKFLNLKIPSEFTLTLYFIPLLSTDNFTKIQKKFKFNNFKNDTIFESKDFKNLNRDELSSYLNDLTFQINLDLLDNDKLISLNKILFDLLGINIQNPNYYFCYNNKLVKLVDVEERIPDLVIKFGKIFLMESPEKNIDNMVSSILKSKKLIYISFCYYAYENYEQLHFKKLENINLNDEKGFFELSSYPRVFNYEMKNEIASLIKIFKILLEYSARYAVFDQDFIERSPTKRNKNYSNKNKYESDFWNMYYKKIIKYKIFIITTKSQKRTGGGIFSNEINKNDFDYDSTNLIYKNSTSLTNYSNDYYVCCFCDKSKNYEFYCDCISDLIIYLEDIFGIEFLQENEIDEIIKNFENKIFQKTYDFNINVDNNGMNIFHKFKKLFEENILLNYENNFENKLLLEFYILCNYENLRILELNKFKDFSTFFDRRNKPVRKNNLNEIYENILEKEIICEENSICNNCKFQAKKIKTIEISKFPKYLIFNLVKKNTKNIYSNCRNKIKNILTNSLNEYNNEEFPLRTDLKYKLDEVTSHSFELFSIINYSGDLKFGKYKILCKNSNSEWIEFDDEFTKLISEKDILKNKNMVFLIYRQIHC